MKIAVLAGGLSPERDVSLSSGALIGRALRKSGHRTAMLDVYTGIKELPGDLDSLFSDGELELYSIPSEAPDLKRLKAESGNGNALIGPGVIEVCRAADVVFLALHGAMGENGQLQATLDAYGVRYTGSGYIGSSLAMDKDLSKRLISGAGVPTAEWIYRPACGVSAEDVAASVGFPCVVKPCSCGSSVGVSIIGGAAELNSALEAARIYEGMVLIERKIEGREFSVGYFDGRVLPPIEIIPLAGFYDYKNKYQSGMTREICPADLTAEQLAKVSELTERMFSALRLRGYARADFILERSSGNFFFLEANTLPGMTPTSLLPQEAAAVGISYADLCCRIAEMGAETEPGK